MRRVVALALASVAAVGFSSTALAHKPSDSYLTLGVGPAGAAGGRCGTGRWDIALRDLDDVVTLDANGDGAITGSEASARERSIDGYALARLSLAVGKQPCALATGSMEIVEHTDGAYVRLPLTFTCPVADSDTLSLDYRLLFDTDPQHRGIVRFDAGHPDERPFLLCAHDHTRAIPLGVAARAASSTSGSFRSFVEQGARHIWGGLDHLLFLLALLLPAVLRRENDGWKPVSAIRPALADVARIVTAFTLAHSITLTLAALGLARMPARLTEPAIAASVVIAAANNVRSFFGRDRWAVAFALGLLHGFGFSSALSDGGLGGGGLLTSLLGFNLGVELGQMALVAAFVPLAFLARRTWFYRKFTLPAGSVAIATLALVWFVERAVDVRLLPWRS